MRRREVIALPVLALPATARAQAQAERPLYTAGQGSAFLPYGQGLAAFLGRQGIAVVARTSAGSLENLAKVEDDRDALGTAFLGSVADALAGTPAAGGRVHRNIRALFPMYETSFQFAVPRAGGITRFEQLAGKRVGAGPARGPAEVFFRAALTEAGIAAEVVSGDPAALAAQLAQGGLDALWQGAIVPIPSLVAAQGQADVLVFGPGEALSAAVIRRLPYLAPTIIPAGTYRGQDGPIHSFAAWNFVVAHAGLDDGTAHAITRAALSLADPARDIHPSAGGTRAANASANAILPFHPAARRFYVEQGVALRAPA